MRLVGMLQIEKKLKVIDMVTEFECKTFEELVFSIDDVEFKYSECKVMAEKEHKKFPNVELILKNPDGIFAEVAVSSSDSEVGKNNIFRGTYDGDVIEEYLAIGLSKLANMTK